ncbi:MAG: SDR family NAD(P)-dependent oxidoreductase [Bacteroidota bacterium]
MKKTAFDIVEGLDLSGKVFLVTGAYSGLGAETTKALLKAKGNVIIAGRNPQSQARFAEELLHNPKLHIQKAQIDASKTLDLGELQSVKDFANYVDGKYEAIDCLLNNAGIMSTPPGKTKDGFEIQMGTNVIGHFLLSKILAAKTKRQVWLSSMGHSLTGTPPGDVHHMHRAPRINLDRIKTVDDKTYDRWYRYQQSKLGNILLAKQFPLAYPNMQACSIHPGVVRTKLGRHISLLTKLKYLFRGLTGKGSVLVSPEVGASTQTLCATLPAQDLVNGAYYANCQVAQEADSAKYMDDAKKLFDYCNEATKSYQ